MSLKQRIKKIEDALAVRNPEPAHCTCWEKHWRSSVDAAYNDDLNIEIEIYPEPDFEKGFCDKCQKPISKSDIEMRDNIEELFGTKN